MAVVLKLRCPDCFDTFRWPGDQKWPDFCPHCRAALSNGKDDEICMPFIRSHTMKSVDAVYRDMERGSEMRQEAAASMLGVSKSDVSDLKITNMNDRRDAEVAHIPVVNDVSRMIDAAPKVLGFQQQGAMTSPDVQSGPFANAGAKFRTQLQRAHGQTFGHHLVSDRPGLETEQPGYRRRG